MAAVPKPMKIIGITRFRYGVDPLICAMPIRPKKESTVPMIGNTLYLPVFAMTRPTPNVAIVTPSICGNVRSPDSVGDTNSESWKYNERKPPAPYVATPANIPRSAHVRMTSFENSRSGIIGSSARCSTLIKAPSPRRAIKRSIRTCCWVQPCRPSSRPIISDAIVRESKPAPMKSSFAVRRLNGSLSAK